MYVIGRNNWAFIGIKTEQYYNYQDGFINFTISRVIYNKRLDKSNGLFITNDYDKAIKVLNEIKDNKDEIEFENDLIISSILKDDILNVDELGVYELVPMLVETK